MGEDGGAKEHLENTKCTNTKFISQDGEKAVEELRRETEFREDKDDGLEDDKESVQDGPERACWLVWNSTPHDVIHVQHRHGRIRGVAIRDSDIIVVIAACFNKVIYCNDVMDECDYVAGEDEQKCDDANYANDIESNEGVCTRRQHLFLEQQSRNRSPWFQKKRWKKKRFFAIKAG